MSGAAGRPGPRIGVIVGPTGSGKSALAERLTERVAAEIVSADALQVYRGFDIGTAKPTAAVRARCRYHCVDIAAPEARLTAAEYGARARAAVEQVLERGKLPLLVGGSGFYIDAALGRLDPLPASEPRWRSTLENLVARHGVMRMHEWLARLDPVRADAIASADRQRVVRALEIVLRTGVTVGALAAATPVRGACEYHPVFVGVRWARPELYRRIDARVERMLAAGWIEEVRDLLAAGVGRGAHAMQAIGYRHLARVVEGEMSIERAAALIARDTRRYAKRQETYCRRWDVQWIDVSARSGPASEAVVESAHRLLSMSTP